MKDGQHRMQVGTHSANALCQEGKTLLSCIEFTVELLRSPEHMSPECPIKQHS